MLSRLIQAFHHSQYNNVGNKKQTTKKTQNTKKKKSFNV